MPVCVVWVCVCESVYVCCVGMFVCGCVLMCTFLDIPKAAFCLSPIDGKSKAKLLKINIYNKYAI